MAKGGKASANGEAQRIVDEVIAEMRWEHFSEMVTIAVPSHDKDSQPLDPTLRRRWCDNTMKFLADLFVGASALPTVKGIFKSKKRNYIWDDTVMIEAWAPKDTCSDPKIVRKIVEHAQRMRVELDQEAVMVVFDKVMKFIKGGK